MPCAGRRERGRGARGAQQLGKVWLSWLCLCEPEGGRGGETERKRKGRTESEKGRMEREKGRESKTKKERREKGIGERKRK